MFADEVTETTTDKVTELTRALVHDERFDDVLDIYVNLAKDAVTNRLFPYEDSATFADVPEKFNSRTAEIACYLINKQGAEGETAHSENGVTRTYGGATIPPSYFVGIVPYCGSIK